MLEPMELESLHSIREVLSLLDRKARIKLGVSEKSIDQALGLISAEDINSPSDIPPGNRSVLDGYAARWRDLSGATEASPVILTIKCRVPVGVYPSECRVGPYEAAEVATGSFIPEGSDVVIPKEYTREEGEKLYVYRSFPGGYGVAFKGEDLGKGEIIIKKGEIIREWHIAILASLGIHVVKVFRPLRVAVFSTGDELVEPWEPLEEGKVYSSTGRLVVQWLRRRGVDAHYHGIVGDSVEEIAGTFNRLLESGYDAAFSTGGTSVGERDYSVKALDKIADDYIHGLALTPGRPGAFGVSGGRIVGALSGMPIAALSEIITVFDPFYRSLVGRASPWDPVVKARLTVRYSSHPGFVNVVRSKLCYSLDGRLSVTPLRVTGSGILSTLLRGNSYFIVEEDVTGLEEGDVVDVVFTGGDLGVCNG